MGNLGYYQEFARFAKNIGGPIRVKLLNMLAGGIIGTGGTLGIIAISKKITNNKSTKQKPVEEAEIYTVNLEGQDNEGVLFKLGDQFKVLERDGDAVLIEKLGDEHNPYFVSAAFLALISDFPL